MGLYVMSRSQTETGIGGRMENGSRDSCLSLLDDQEKKVVLMMVITDEEEEEENDGYFLDSSSSVSSIGKNSDEEIDNENDDEEVQSSYNKVENGSFDSLQALEEALPARRGMSKFFNGKAKSFARLADVSVSSSINEIAKAENVYNKRRRNALAKSLVFDKNNSSLLKSSGRASKKFKSSNSLRSTLALAVAMTNSSKNSDTIENEDSNPFSYSSLSQHYSQIR